MHSLHGLLCSCLFIVIANNNEKKMFEFDETIAFGISQYVPDD